VIHCHILIHEDLGMMMTVNITEQGGSPFYENNIMEWTVFV